MNAEPVIANAARNDAAIESLYATGHWLYMQGRFKDAAALFRVMLLCACRDERGWLGLGASHEEMEHAATALAIYEAGVAMCVPGVRVELARARLLRKLGRDDEASDAARSAGDRAREAGDEWLVALVAAETGGAS